MTPDDEATDDAVTPEYQRASAAAAGRPAAATRAAILAEARALAQRRATADRDPRLRWALAASVAVIGIALLLWRQVSLQTQPVYHAPQAMESPSSDLKASTEAYRPSQDALPAPTTPLTSPQVVSSGAAAETAQRRELTAMNAMRASPPQLLPAAPAPAAVAPVFAKGEVSRPRAAAADAAAPVRLESAERASTPFRVDISAAAILRQQFPAENASTSPPHTLWVLRDLSGTVLRTGTLMEASTLQRLVRELQDAYPDQRIGEWTITPLINERGVPVEVAVATLLN